MSTRTPVSAAALQGSVAAGLPEFFEPQLATLADSAPAGEDWLHEIKLDGYRILARLESGSVRLLTRNAQNWTHRFPEIAEALAGVPVDRALLDGEVVAMENSGATSFRQLQEALTSGDTHNLLYYIFDLIHLDGYRMTSTPQRERKRALAALFQSIGDEHLRYCEHVKGSGPAFNHQACDLHLEGTLSKRADATYRSGRGSAWLKIKCTRQDEFVVGGYTAPRGRRRGFGALLLGAWHGEALTYVGKVGTGFSNEQLQALSRRLRKQETARPAFAMPVPRMPDVKWVHPEMVVDVEYSERTRDGLLRHPRFRGVREDKQAEEVIVAARQGAANRKSSSPGEGDRVAGIRITHPERVMYPRQGVTKLDLANYYARAAEFILPWIERRPLTLLRCPQGREKDCFYQKHPYQALAGEVPRVAIAEQSGRGDYVYIEDIADVVALVQWGTLEFHVWGCRVENIEHPDMLVFDLDPSREVQWRAVISTARRLRDRLQSLGLHSFLRTTGGKGLHLVVPLTPATDWTTARDFARAVAARHVEAQPDLLTLDMAKAKRRGRIFIDYLRNGRGNTAVVNFSTRARPGAPVAVPLRWNELNGQLAPDKYRIDNVFRRLGAIAEDPWSGFDDARRELTADMFAAVGLEGG